VQLQEQTLPLVVGIVGVDEVFDMLVAVVGNIEAALEEVKLPPEQLLVVQLELLPELDRLY
jgi:hypothetical protein